jgi:hypothetical protein
MQLRGLHSCKLVTSCIYNHFEVKSICILVKVLLLFKICSGADKCYNRTLCNELLSILLPAKPPFHPRQFAACAVVGNSGDLLKTEFGQEIDAHDAVFRDNEAPVNKVITLDHSLNLSELNLGKPACLVMQFFAPCCSLSSLFILYYLFLFSVVCAQDLAMCCPRSMPWQIFFFERCGISICY